MRDEPGDEAIREAECACGRALAAMRVDVQISLSLLRNILCSHACADFFIVRGDGALVLGRQLSDVVAEEGNNRFVLLENRQDTRLNLAVAAGLVQCDSIKDVLEIGVVVGCTTVCECEALLCIVAAATLLHVGRLAVAEGRVSMAVVVRQAAEDEELNEFACLSLVLRRELGCGGCRAEGSNLRRELVRLLDEVVQGAG